MRLARSPKLRQLLAEIGFPAVDVPRQPSAAPFRQMMCSQASRSPSQFAFELCDLLFESIAFRSLVRLGNEQEQFAKRRSGDRNARLRLSNSDSSVNSSAFSSRAIVGNSARNISLGARKMKRTFLFEGIRDVRAQISPGQDRLRKLCGGERAFLQSMSEARQRQSTFGGAAN